MAAPAGHSEPCTQATGTLVPGGHTLPDGHVSVVLLEPAGHNTPPGHAVGAVALAVQKLPTGHSVGLLTLAAQKKLGGHCVGAAELAGQYAPAGQGSCSPVLPSHTKPAEHDVEQAAAWLLWPPRMP